MHSCVYVLIGPNTDTDFITRSVDEALAPFSEDLQVDPYKVRLSANTVSAMARHYGINESDHTQLIEHMQDWLGEPGGRDELGLFSLSTRNPHGKWDWYEIGGRFDGSIRGKVNLRRPERQHGIEANVIAAWQLVTERDFAKRVPFALVTPLGEWIERSSIETTSTGWFVCEEPPSRWTQRVKHFLKRYSDCNVVCVDAHS